VPPRAVPPRAVPPRAVPPRAVPPRAVPPRAVPPRAVPSRCVARREPAQVDLIMPNTCEQIPPSKHCSYAVTTCTGEQLLLGSAARRSARQARSSPFSTPPPWDPSIGPDPSIWDPPQATAASPLDPLVARGRLPLSSDTALGSGLQLTSRLGKPVSPSALSFSVGGAKHSGAAAVRSSMSAAFEVVDESAMELRGKYAHARHVVLWCHLGKVDEVAATAVVEVHTSASCLQVPGGTSPRSPEDSGGEPHQIPSSAHPCMLWVRWLRLGTADAN
jgi:hypothetical protein